MIIETSKPAYINRINISVKKIASSCKWYARLGYTSAEAEVEEDICKHVTNALADQYAITSVTTAAKYGKNELHLTWKIPEL